VTRLFVVVEGQAEEAFVKGILGPHLRSRGVEATPIIVATSRRSGGRKHKGGGHWKHWEADLLRVMREQAPAGAWITTMFDLYGLPRDFPDIEAIRAGRGADEKVAAAERALHGALAGMIGERHLIAHVQRHEFEALVLAALDHLAALLDDPRDLDGLESLRREIGRIPPEDVDDGEDTAPSRRLAKHIPGYDKVLHGELALTSATVPALAGACPHFGHWVRRLEAVGPPCPEAETLAANGSSNP
jgi:hypothetical protein